MITEVITFWGIVQGVGFRPTLSRIAAKYRMRGQVRNMGAFVQLIVTDEPERIDSFIEAVRAGKPRMADIMRIDREIIDTVPFDDFRIVSSAASEDEIVAVPADIAVCDECLAEFRDASDRRYLHPFISCVNCGPRYTIMDHLPYDRDTTTMDDFPMCERCEGEYGDPASRRYHAQTVSCHDCGPKAIWRANPKLKHNGDDSFHVMEPSITEAITAIAGGGVIALKGIGGYYFVCGPYDEAAVKRLRDIKVREHKPFAVMFASVEQARVYCEVGSEEESLLISPKRPIVLLERREGHPEHKRDGSFCVTEPSPFVPQGDRSPALPPFAPGVSSASRFIGAFLPSMALQYMLVEALGPLIMTSANISDLPIVRDDEEMFAALENDERIAGALYHERRIVRRLDDSVTRVTDGTPQLIRRAKGWTPVPIYVRGTDRLSKDDQVFAAGADLKSAFALTKGSFVYMSQYIGDMENVETERVYAENLDSMRKFFGIKPHLIAYDMHPLYLTAKFAKEYAKSAGSSPAGRSGAEGFGSPPPVRRHEAGVPCLIPVQHHHAHVASVIAEHGLKGSVIGVAFDGTGYGPDGTIWGGEILLCEGAEFERFSHLRDILITGGDSSMRDGWKSAVCRAAACENDGHLERRVDCVPAVSRCFDIDISYALKHAQENGTLSAYANERKTIEAAVARCVNTVTTSSMGRLFDAVASLLGICHVNRYEGECAIMLENAAARALRPPGNANAVGNTGGSFLCVEDRATDALALRFHLDVAHAILSECREARAKRGANIVCLSGGVFQNKILTEEALRILRADGFIPYYNVAVPPNDGCIALGQAYVAMQTML